MEQEFTNKILNIIMDMSDCEITVENHLLADTGIDSLDFIDIVLNIERDLKVHLDDSLLKEIEKNDIVVQKFIEECYERRITK